MQQAKPPDLDVGQLARLRADARSGRARRIRLAAGISLAELGAASGTSAATVSRWETGKRSPRPAAAVRYARALAAIEGAASEATEDVAP